MSLGEFQEAGWIEVPPPPVEKMEFVTWAQRLSYKQWACQSHQSTPIVPVEVQQLWSLTLYGIVNADCACVLLLCVKSRRDTSHVMQQSACHLIWQHHHKVQS